MNHKRLLLWAVSLLFIVPLMGQVNVSLTGDVFICEGESAQLDCNPSGGDGNYTFLWSPAAGLSCTTCQSPIATPTTTTTYTLVVADGQGEQASESLVITVAANPEIDLDATVVTNTTCNGAATGAIDLVVAGGTFPAAFFWVGPNGFTSTTEDVSSLIAGTYTVTITSADGCTAEASFNIVEDSALEVTSDVTNASCDGSSFGAIDIEVTGGIEPYSYEWSTGDETQDIVDLTSGFYSVVITDVNGCLTIANFVIEGAPILNGQITEPFCNGDNSGFINVSSGSTDWTFEWSDGFIGPIRQGLPAGIYCVTVTDTEGCATDACYTLTEPAPLELTVTSTDVTCEGQNDGSLTVFVTGGVPPYTYLWANGATTQTITNLAAGVYTVTVVDANGCLATTEGVISENPSFTLDVTGLPTETCDFDFTLIANVTGSGSYTYLWEIDGVVVSTSSELTNPSPGLITVIVTDDNGCTILNSVLFDPSPTAIINSTGILSCATGTTVLDGTGSTAGPDYAYTWTGPDGFTSDQLIVTVSTPGNYLLTVNNTAVADCSSTAEVIVNDISLDFGNGIITTVVGCNDYRLQAIVPDDYFGELAFEWTFPDGVTTSNEIFITPTQTGVYTLSTEAVGTDCIFYSTVFIDLEAASCATINGVVHQDENEDCAPDTADLPLEGWQVIATDGTASYVAFTDSEGYFEINVPVAVNSVSLVPPSTSWDICVPTIDLDPALMEGEIRTLDFPVKQLANCPELDVSLSATFLRRCFSSYYYINVTNIGTEDAINPEVTLVMDDFLSYLGSNITPTGIVDQTVVWTLGSILPNQTVTIWVQVMVSCNAQLGQTHCSEVFATPDPLCAPAQNWSGTNLDLTGDCDGTDVIFTVRNTGSTNLAETVNYIVIEDGVAMMQSQTLEDLGGDQEEMFAFPANGSTYTFQLDQVENHPYSELLSLSIEGCGLNDQGEFSTGFVNQFSQSTATSTTDIFCLENIGAYDPNDKAALPVGYGEQHYIVPETELYYRIRFQNTGTDTAFTVVIRDTLSEYLDLRSLDLGVSSHAYTANISGDRALTFTFNNILLPDSTTNLEASQGFVDFRISPDVSTPLETVIENDAAIYFDFNDPVITNTVFHTLGRNFLEVVDTEVIAGIDLKWNVYPNPVADQLQVELEGELPAQMQVQIFDAEGRLLTRVKLGSNNSSISVADLPAGWYQLRLTTTDGQLLGTAKLVKK